MAVKSPMPAISEDVNPIRYPHIEVDVENGDQICQSEITEEPQLSSSESPSTPAMVDKMYVMVGREVKESELTLEWALNKSQGRKICICHVHQRSRKMPIMGPSGFPISLLEDREVDAYRESEREVMLTILSTYNEICACAGVQAEILSIERDSIEKGIVELIAEHSIKELVMGGAADKHYSKKIVGRLKSKKAMYVCRQAPVDCHICFICRGYLIYERVSKSDGVSTSPMPIPASPNVKDEQFPSLRSRSVAVGQNLSLNLDDPTLDFRRTKSGNCQIRLMALPSSVRMRAISDGRMADDLFHQYDHFVKETETSERKAYEESIRKRNTEKEAIEAMCRVKAAENLYSEEVRQRKEIEDALSKGKEKIEKMKRQVNKVQEELRLAEEHKSSLEIQIENSDKKVQELEEEIFSAVELLQKYKKDKIELQVERDNVLRVVEVLREKQEDEGSITSMPEFFSEFPFSEVEKSTRNFDPALEIGKGGYGRIYKGRLRHTLVAIKMLNAQSSHGPSAFQHEVNVLSKLRHPNLVTLIGACPEAYILIYEYLENGSLEDRLCCKNNTPPLSSQTRIRIAAELCSVLMFLHSSRPHGIVHCDLKPDNILLDFNYVSKLSDFGICHLIPQEDYSSNKTLFWITEPKGTPVYMDPRFYETGELSPKSDVYSFGIILLRLLTGRPATGIKKEVENALDKGALQDVLDPAAGDWPFVQAKQLAHLAMSCCDVDPSSRPDLSSDVWRILEPMRISCGFSSCWLGSDEKLQIPAYFLCPIFQEIMQDPVVAADGFTYEAEAFRGWLEGGHDTSPMTNVKLAHENLVPNRALRSAIQEWLQQK